MTADSPDPRAALAAAFHAGDVARVRQLLNDNPQLKSTLDDPIPGGSFGSTALLFAVAKQSRQMIDVLLDAGADINARSHWWAGSFGVLDTCDTTLASFLIQRGAKIDAHAAARLGMLDELTKLVATDPNVVHSRGGDGQLPLHFASTIEIARYLLDHGADIDATDIDHESTAAQWMLRDRQAVARYLVSRGCKTDVLMAAALGDAARVRRHLDDDPSCTRTCVSDEYFPKRNPRSGGTIYYWTLGGGKSPHQVAREYGHMEIYQMLMDASPPDVKLIEAAKAGDEATFRALASAEGVPTARNPRVLADAARDNNAPAVRLMLGAGWTVGARGQHGGSPLHWAAWHGNADMVRAILPHAPPIESADNDYNATPLQWAMHGSLNGWHRKSGDYTAVVDALLQAGAKPPETVKDGDATAAVLDVLRHHPRG